jgi:hypothetical protein
VRVPDLDIQPRTLAALLAVTAAVLVVAIIVAMGGDSGGNDPSVEEQAAARRQAATVTEANNGGDVTVAPAKPFIVDLEGSADAPWGVPRANTADLALVSSSQDPDGSAAATFLPLEVAPGATITAERVPTCRLASPACDTPTETFTVTIRVGG